MERRHSGPERRILGFVLSYSITLEAINQDKMPALHKPVIKDIGYHIRVGEHDVTEYDWSCYLDFADKLFEINNGMHPKNNANHRIDPHF
jgi:hypothetical protein